LLGWSHSFVRAAKNLFFWSLFTTIANTDQYSWMISSSTLAKNYSFATHSGHYHFKSVLFKSAFSLTPYGMFTTLNVTLLFKWGLVRKILVYERNFSCILFIQCQSCTEIRFEFQIFILSTDAVLKQSFTLILIWLIEHCIDKHERKRILRQIAFSSKVFSRDVSVLIEFNLKTSHVWEKQRNKYEFNIKNDIEMDNLNIYLYKNFKILKYYHLRIKELWQHIEVNNKKEFKVFSPLNKSFNLIRFRDCDIFPAINESKLPEG
jgi:hypothetical protein